MYFMKLGQFERARRELKQALRFDPHSLIINADLALPFLFQGQYAEAVEQYRKILETDQDFIWARFFLGWTYERSGQFSEAIAEFQKARLIDDRPEVSAMIAQAHAVSGRRDEAISILNNLEEQSRHHYISAYYIALIYAGLGDKERAFAWLEKAYSDRNEWLVWLKVDPRFDELWAAPQFAELLKRIGFSHGAVGSHDRDRRAAAPPDGEGGGPGSYVTHALIGLAYLEKGLFEEAVTELQRTTAVTNGKEASALLGYAFAASGRRDEARGILEGLQRVEHQRDVDPAFMAVICTGLKETDRAFKYLEEAHENRSPWLALLNVSSLFESLRSDPRFTNLLRRIWRADHTARKDR
jgi:tetratricopeptide (TPR) repeat protein